MLAGFGEVVPVLLEQVLRLSAAGVAPNTVVNPSVICVLPPGPDAVQTQVLGYPTQADGATLGAAVPLNGVIGALPAKPVPLAEQLKDKEVAFVVAQLVV